MFDISKYDEVLGGKFEGSALKLSAGGKIVYSFYIPFNAASVELKYTLSREIANIKLYIGDDLFIVELTGDSTVIKLEPHVIQGEYKIIITTDTAMDLYAVRIHKEIVVNEAIIANYETIPNLTEYEKAIQAAVILSSKSSVFMVNGGRRYVNNNDPREVPYEENGEIYLPIHAFARAFGYYYEEKEHEWIITRDDVTFHYKNGELIKQNYSSKPFVIDNITKVVNGKTYFPIKYFAEIDGKILEKKNDIYIVEYKSNVSKILEANIFEELSSRYRGWYLENKVGTTYYVSKESVSCDNNDGSKEKPFRTIAKASEVAKVGDTVIIRGGIYHEILAPKNNGTVSNPIVFKAADGEQVVLTATDELGECIGTEGDMLIYNALTDLGYGKNQIFYNGENLAAGRHPNENTLPALNILPENLANVWPTQGNIQITPNNATEATSETDLDQMAGTWNGATLIAFTGAAWSLGMAKVESSEPGVLHLTDVCKRWWFDPAKHMHDTSYAYLTNHKNTVDLPGEWAYDDGKIYIIPPNGETAKTLKLEQKVRQVVADLTNSKYIRIEGIDTYGGGVKMNNSEMCMIREGKYRYISHYTYSRDQRDGYIDAWDKYNPNGAPPRGEMGFYIGGRDNIVINNSFEFSAAAAIYSVGLYGYFENNYIADCGYMSSYVGGLYIGTEAWEKADTPRGGNAVYSNTITRAGRHCYGISANEDWWTIPTDVSNKFLAAFLPEDVAYNDISNGAIASRDTAPWYLYGCTLGTERLKSKHHHNLIWNSWANEGVMNAAVYYDGFANMAQFYNNIIFRDCEVEYTPELFLQIGEKAPAIIDVWNNSLLGYMEGGKKCITAQQYPSGKIFRSGVDWLLEDKTPYLNSVNCEMDFITVENAILSSGATIEGGLFEPKKNGEWICFQNIDFLDKDNALNSLLIYNAANSCNTGDKISIIIGESLTNYIAKEEVTIIAKQPNEKVVECTEVRIRCASGIANLYIKVEDYKSIKIEKIQLRRVNDLWDDLKVGMYADEGAKISGNMKLRSSLAAVEDHHYYNETTGGSVLEFKNVEVCEDCNELLIKMSTTQIYTQMIRIHVGSKDGEVIGEFISNKISWYDYSLEAVPMSTPLKAGAYDIYVEFIENGEKTSNFLWFGLGYNKNYTNGINN